MNNFNNLNKEQFCLELKSRLSCLPQPEIEKSVSYYSEIIDDRIEEGLSEKDAVSALGNIDDIISNIMMDMPVTTLIHARVQKSKNNSSSKVLWTVLVILGFPLWLPLILAFAGIVFCVYISIWTIIISLYAVVAAIGIGSLTCLAFGGVYCFIKSVPFGICYIGAGIVFASLVLFMIIPVNLMGKGLIIITVKFAGYIKSLIIGGKKNEK